MSVHTYKKKPSKFLLMFSVFLKDLSRFKSIAFEIQTGISSNELLWHKELWCCQTKCYDCFLNLFVLCTFIIQSTPVVTWNRFAQPFIILPATCSLSHNRLSTRTILLTLLWKLEAFNSLHSLQTFQKDMLHFDENVILIYFCKVFLGNVLSGNFMIIRKKF